MALESGGKKYPFDWNIEEIKVVYSKDPNKFYNFKVEKWIDKNQKLNAAITQGAVEAIDSTNDSELGFILLQKSKIKCYIIS
jgi:hypothetical protein